MECLRCSFQVFEKVGRPEVLRDLLVETGDNLVNGFLPAGLGVLARLDRLEELAQRLRYDENKRGRDLLLVKELKNKLDFEFCW